MTTEQIHTIAWLNRAYLARLKVDALIAQQEELRANAERNTLALGNTGASNSVKAGNSTENVLIELVDLTNKIATEIKAQNQIYNEVNSVVNDVEDITLQTVLRYRYLCYHKWQTIAELMNYDERTIRRKHKQAIDEVVRKCP